jgi:hypothetical protein
MGSLPNFLLIGAEKSGSTSVYGHLRAHPEIFMSRVKEPLFFAFEGRKVDFKGPGDESINRRVITDFGDYSALFAGSEGHRAVGEASVSYLYYPESAERAAKYVPDAKLIAILRCPADRAFSNYQHAIREQRETLSFDRALRAEPDRVIANWSPFFHYRAKGWYYTQLKHWMQYFPSSQFLVLLYEDLSKDPAGVMREIYEFLGVDPEFHPMLRVKKNVSGKPRSQWLHEFIKSNSSMHALARSVLPTALRARMKAEVIRVNLSRSSANPATRRQLMSSYAPDIAKLQDLIGRDLTVWR